MTTITQLRRHRYDAADSFVRAIDADEAAVRDALAKLGLLELDASNVCPDTRIDWSVSTEPRYGDGTTVRVTIGGRARTDYGRQRLLDAWPRISAAAVAQARRLLAAVEEIAADRPRQPQRRLRLAI